jgi:MYXO-CTERM domain-containing protein
VYLFVGLDYFSNGKTAVLRSTDYGDHFDVTDVTAQFHAHGNGMGRQTGEKLAVDPNLGSVLYCGTRRSGLFKSTDYGASWSHLAGLDVTTTPNDAGISFVLFDKASGTTGSETRRFYVGVSRAGTDNLYESDDAGVSFTPVVGAPTTFMPGRAALASNGALYVTYGNGAGPYGVTDPNEPMDQGAVWRYQPGSATEASTDWTDVTPPLQRAYSGISVDASNPDHLLATTVNTYVQQPWGYGDRIFRSTDGGATWTDLIAAGVTMDDGGHPWIEGNAIHWAGSIQIDPFDPQRAFVTSGNGVFMTENLSAAKTTWKFATDGLEELVPLDAVSIPDGPLVSAMADYDGFVHQDLAVSPADGEFQPSMGSTYGIAVAAARPGTWVRTGASAYWTDDAGRTWTQLTGPDGVSARGRVALSADGSTLLWSSRATVFRTDDKGATWTTPTGIDFRTTPVADTVAANTFYAFDAATGALHVSTDKGVTFTVAGNAGTGAARLIRAVPGVEGEIWIALNAGGLTRSTDAGATFSRVASVSAASAVGFGKAPDGETFPAVYIWGSVKGVTGLFRSDDRGATWLRINDDAHEFGGPGNGQFVLGDMNAFGRVFMSSAGRGIVYGQITGTPTTLPPLVLDAGAPEPDAGTTTTTDASSDAPLEAAIEPLHATGGCACRTQAPSGGSSTTMGAVAGLIVFLRRRRRGER